MNKSEAAAILGISVSATEAEARKAYLARARLMHPDRFHGASESDVAAATAAMAQLNQAMEVFKSATDTFTDESFTNATPPPPPRSDFGARANAGSSGLWTDPRNICELCGWGPAVQVKFYSVAGYVIFWRWGSYDGMFCRDCGEAMYNEAQRSSLLKGWWGVLSPLLTIFAFFSNLSRIGAVRSLRKPVGRYEAAYTLFTEPIRFSVPWYKRPASIIATIVAAIIIFAIIDAVITETSGPRQSSSSNPSGASAAPTAVVGTCWSQSTSSSTLKQVSCSSPEVTYKVNRIARQEGLCPGKFIREKNGSFACLSNFGRTSTPTPNSTAPAVTEEIPQASFDPTPARARWIPIKEMQTCIEGDKVKRECFEGTEWIYGYCWAPNQSRMVLQRLTRGKWETVESIASRANGSLCRDAQYPIPVDFTIREKGPGVNRYRVKESLGVYFEEFQSTTTAPRRFYQTCVSFLDIPKDCNSGVQWRSESCWTTPGDYTLELKRLGKWVQVSKGLKVRNRQKCYDSYQFLASVKNTLRFPGKYEYRLSFGPLDRFPLTVTVSER